MVEFVSYDGKYPSLCMGVLTVKVNEKVISLPKGSLIPGGCIYNDGFGDNIEKGPWSVDDDIIPDELHPYIEEIAIVAKYNIPWGCCGGCISK